MPMTSLRAFARQWIRRLAGAGVPEPVESVRFVLSSVLKQPVLLESFSFGPSPRKAPPSYRWHNLKTLPTQLTPMIVDSAETMLRRRLNREPVQYILGEWDFRKLNLKLEPPTLIPRPETEQLVELVLERISEHGSPLKVLEVGCGSGAIALSLLKEAEREGLQVVAVDCAESAVRLTLQNAERNRITSGLFVHQFRLQNDESSFRDLTNLCGNQVDILVSNPPYIPSSEVDDLDPEIRMFEDRQALDGGIEGLDVLRALCGLAAVCLRPGGSAFLEVDSRHPTQLAHILAPSRGDLPLRFRRTVDDFAFRARFVEVLHV